MAQATNAEIKLIKLIRGLLYPSFAMIIPSFLKKPPEFLLNRYPISTFGEKYTQLSIWVS